MEPRRSNRENRGVPPPPLTNIVLAWAKTFNHKVKQLDVRTAFLNASLSEPVYVQPPPGFSNDGLLKSEKALYGLKQSPLQWYKTISSYLISIGFVKSITDRCLFKNDDIVLLLYDDDIILTGPDDKKLSIILDKLEQKFEITDLGKINDYLGINIIEKPDHYELSQSSYVRNVLNEFNMSDCQPAKLPMSELYLPSDDEDEDQSLPVQKLIGSLSYVANRTRPDNRFSVNWLSHYVSRPTTSLWKACKQSIRYLAHS